MDKRKISEEAPRWIRIGVLSLITLGPVISSIATWLRSSSLMPRFLSKDQTDDQSLLKRGEQVTEALIERGNKLSHDVVERGSQLTHTIVERGGEVARKMTERRNLYLTITGFGIGLLVSGIAAYLFIRKRIQQPELDEEPIELTPELVGTRKSE